MSCNTSISVINKIINRLSKGAYTELRFLISTTTAKQFYNVKTSNKQVWRHENFD